MLLDLEGITQRLYFVKFKFNQDKKVFIVAAKPDQSAVFLGNFAEVSATEPAAAASMGTIDW